MTFPSCNAGYKRRRSGMRVDTILANTNKNKQTAKKCFLLEIKLSTRYFYIVFLFKFGAVKNKEEMAVRRGSGCGSIGYARNQNFFFF
jgi:hypothetical protein